MEKTYKAFSLVVAMGLVFVTVFLIIIIVEFMVPFSRNIKGVENATKSYYLAYSGLERGLYFFSEREGKNIINDITYNTGSVFSYGYSFKTFSKGTTLPFPKTGESEYNDNWNKISIGNPIQISIGYKYIKISNFTAFFRVPDLNKDGLNKEIIKGDNSLPIINWQLSSDSQTLNSISDSLIKLSEVKGNNIKFYNRMGRKIDGKKMTIGEFYDTYCSDKCIMRFSIINPIFENSTKASIPYLEWQIQVSPNNIPLRYSRLESKGNVYGFTTDLKVRYPQDTIPEALDFTIFQ